MQILLQCCNTRTTQRNYEYKSCMPTANYEDCLRCVGQACQTYIKYASWLAMSVTDFRAKEPAGGLKLINLFNKDDLHEQINHS